ncbi:MAG TPA: sulfotransferase, partial [Candidatus Limnocylindrales bacterium]|nr:sulfotransferase [Candidatus Limnocylindrales bacterium]
MSGPVFLTGLDRSGKTPLRRILDAHPSLAFSRRTELWTSYHGRFGDLAVHANLERCLSALLARPAVAELVSDRAALVRAAGEGEPSYGRLFAAIHRAAAERRGKRRWGDQDASLERVAGLVLADLPDARILHLVRDPRDRYAEVVRAEGRRLGGVGAATAAWLTSAHRGGRNAATWPDRYRLVRYEDLVRRPEATLREVCAFIGEPFDPVLLDAAEALAGAEPAIGRFRAVLRPAEVAFVEAVAGRAMRRL